MAINPYSLTILITLSVAFGLDVASNLLNLRALRFEVPPALAGVYPPDKYRQSQEYTSAATRFGLVSATFRLAVLLAFWFAGGFNELDQVVRGWGYAPIVNGLLYTGILGLSYSALMLPFSAYATFVLEGRFGFNRTTPGTFVMDKVKGLVLAVLLGAPLLAGILALFEYTGRYAWLYCWVAITLFTLVVQFVAPVWIMPLFNKFTPMTDNALKESILKYARSVGYEVNNVYVMDGSRRSTKSNAFFTGFGRTRRIALFDTLIAQHTAPELVAVLAHEIGHYKKKHVPQGMVISILHTGIVFFLLSVFLGSAGLFQAFRMEQPSIYTGLLFFGLLYTPLEVLVSIWLQMLSRRNEYQADRFAAVTIEEPRSLADALKKLSASNLSNMTPHPFYVFLNYSHPPLLQRVQAIERHAEQRSHMA